jgi:hypothetical protein
MNNSERIEELLKHFAHNERIIRWIYFSERVCPNRKFDDYVLIDNYIILQKFYTECLSCHKSPSEAASEGKTGHTPQRNFIKGDKNEANQEMVRHIHFSERIVRNKKLDGLITISFYISLMEKYNQM